MKIEKTYSIKEGAWTQWNKTIAEAIKDFCSVYTFYPNILVANDHTFSQFDFLVNVMPGERQCVSSKDDITGVLNFPSESTEISLGGFTSCDVDLDFAVDHQLADREFSLVYDDEPDWNEPEIPEDCPKDELEPCLF